jgi:hypothetical protein
MTRARLIGFGLWGFCAVMTALTAGFAWAAANQHMDRGQAVALAVAFGIAAEASFWSGGAALGFSFFAKRSSGLARLFRRTPPQ